jgi:SAM-dependent methyltransferase
MNPTQEIWNKHYLRNKSRLSFPDENLVRMLAKLPWVDSKPSFSDHSGSESGSISDAKSGFTPKRPAEAEQLKALDFGCGSGRHSLLLHSFGYKVYSTDYTENSIALTKSLVKDSDCQVLSSPPYPYPSDFFNIIVSWGVIHYNSPEVVKQIIAEKYRILKPGGYLLGTVRAETDTFLKSNQNDNIIQTEDLKNGFINLYNLSELEGLLNAFSKVEIGYMERTPLNKLDRKIAHYYFQASK